MVVLGVNQAGEDFHMFFTCFSHVFHGDFEWF